MVPNNKPSAESALCQVDVHTACRGRKVPTYYVVETKANNAMTATVTDGHRGAGSYEIENNNIISHVAAAIGFSRLALLRCAQTVTKKEIRASRLCLKAGASICSCRSSSGAVVVNNAGVPVSDPESLFIHI